MIAAVDNVWSAQAARAPLAAQIETAATGRRIRAFLCRKPASASVCKRVVRAGEPQPVQAASSVCQA